MEANVITDILSGIVLAGILWYLAGIGKTQKKQSKSLISIDLTLERASADSENFEENCKSKTESITRRLGDHGKDIDELNITQREQDVRLKDHDRRLEKVEQI